MGLLSLVPVLGVLLGAFRHGGPAAVHVRDVVTQASAAGPVAPAQALAAACILVLSLRLSRRADPRG